MAECLLIIRCNIDREVKELSDSRNLRDDLKGLNEAQIVQILDKSRIPLQIAIENLDHDFNIGSIVRTANAFNIKAVHIIGSRRWNSRGAMKTDAYMHIYHHYSISEFEAWLLSNDELRNELRSTSIASDPRNAERLGDKTEIEKAPIDPSINAKLYGVDLLENVSKPLESEHLTENAILMFGSENAGLSIPAQQICLKSSGKILHITQFGSTRSINVGHAASIAMFKWILDNM